MRWWPWNCKRKPSLQTGGLWRLWVITRHGGSNGRCCRIACLRLKVRISSASAVLFFISVSNYMVMVSVILKSSSDPGQGCRQDWGHEPKSTQCNPRALWKLSHCVLLYFLQILPHFMIMEMLFQIILYITRKITGGEMLNHFLFCLKNSTI